MALRKVKGSLDRIFDKNLQDLVRGIRNHKEDEAHFISQCIDEIKQELKQENLAVKANAVNKLVYLQMLGYDISWAAFNVIEVMSSLKFTFKRIGYYAAAQSFHAETDVLMLATNLIKKDLNSQNGFDAAVALNGLSCFLTTDLARDLANDIMSLMSSIRPYTRKRAVLISYKIFLCYPEALRPAFPRLKEKLEDPDPGVQSAAVNVICELARKNPKNYLSLAPVFFKLMTSSTNNWVLIKIIKLFGALTPLEPRLGKKLIEPLTNLIHNTSAMSLLYECINTVIQGMQDHGASIQLCVQKLRILIEDTDQNLKYLGLLAMSRILKTHPKAVQAHKDLILQCLDDKDESIRLRALDLLFGMVSKKNLMEIVKKLMVHVEKAEGAQYRDELILKIIEICNQNNFQFITNFEWYITVLIELTRIDGASRHGPLVSSQIQDVAIRVKSIREFAANQMANLVENAHAISGKLKRNGMQEVLYAAAYICGEFAEFLDNPDGVIHAMLRPRVLAFPSHIQATFVQNIMKVYVVALVDAEKCEERERASALTRSLLEKLPSLVQSSNLEVQERASCIVSILKYIDKMQSKGTSVGEDVALLFKGELNPVAPKAQRKVPIPQGLDLDAWINDPPSSSEEEVDPEKKMEDFAETYNEIYSPTRERQKELSKEEIEKRKEERRVEMASNPNYLVASGADGYQKPDAEEETGIAEIDISIPLHVPGLPSSERYLRMEQERRRRHQAEKVVKKKNQQKMGKKGKKKKKNRIVEEEEDDDEDLAPVHHVEITHDEMPEGAVKTDSEDESAYQDPHRALDMDLDSPLTAAESLPVRKHREVVESPKREADDAEPKEKKKHKKKDKARKKKSRKRQTDNLLVEEPPTDQLNGDVTPDESDVTPKGDRSNAKEQKKEKDDLSFWLSSSDAKTNQVAQVNGNDQLGEAEEAEGDKKAKKKSKKKGKKGEKRRKAAKETDLASAADEDAIEQQDTFQLNSYKPLCEDKHLRVVFETRASASEERQFVISCVFSNLSADHVKGIEFNILDTLNTKLIRDGSGREAVSIPFSLPPQSRNECQLRLTAASVSMPQRIRGTVTYMVTDEGGTSQEKIDFKLHVPCSAYLVTTPFSSTSFTKLLSSGEMSEKSSTRISASDLVFGHVIKKLCFFLKFSVVEQIGDSASLYTSSIQRHHVCLLVKTVPNGLSVDGKSDNSTLLSNIMDEVKELVQA